MAAVYSSGFDYWSTADRTYNYSYDPASITWPVRWTTAASSFTVLNTTTDCSSVWDRFYYNANAALYANPTPAQWFSPPLSNQWNQYLQFGYGPWTENTPETDEERARRLAEDEEIRERYQVEQEERRAARHQADAKALELLLSSMDREQRSMFDREGHFHVHTKDGLRTYELRPGLQPRRIKSEDGSQYSYCIHSKVGAYPPADEILAFKLLLEADEEQFLAIANATRHNFVS